MNEAGGVVGECSQAFKEAFKRRVSTGRYASHAHGQVLGASSQVAQCLQVCGLDLAALKQNQIHVDLEGCA